jgi:geranylgeranyl transferase type-2 subunit beta
MNDYLLGAFGAHPDHDAHILSTLSAIQILVTHNAMNQMDIARVVKCRSHHHPSINRLTSWLLDILSLQQPSGVFAGDSFGETDTRFLYCAVNALSLLDHLADLDIEKTVSYIRQCKNFDGGFGATIGAESHAAQGW